MTVRGGGTGPVPAPGKGPPGGRDRMLHAALARAVVRAGQPGGIRFTERQLYYALCRVLHPLHRAPRRLPFTLAPPVAYSRFRAALDAYGPGPHGPADRLPGLLAPEPVVRHPAGRHTPEADLFDYGLPRLLVCQSDAVAHMLRANALPMESACPVHGAGELPLDPAVLRMLGLAGRATVYLLHDASPAGLAFAARFTAATPLPSGVRTVALGLRPRQAAALHLTHGRPEHRPGAYRIPPGAAPALTRREHAWLCGGRFAEVEAVPPAVLLRTVHRMVRGIRAPRPARRRLRGVRETGFLSRPAE
ncbi:hypothetical protein V1J52_03070 [Streptomyces sp. TRM 70351]|uniref:hypothetical protein n=1 Tax=Streptomyces sp. TRM 70351 TaxID=3116552 RepID=UPI002E7BBCB6|nr:hypothetical protein [Streptomyces sp. TRM 70351]MEE1927172.1 hypothetical protein [Streptomyces sp. TRM 70351]